jgi:hypothetical protein
MTLFNLKQSINFINQDSRFLGPLILWWQPRVRVFGILAVTGQRGAGKIWPQELPREIIMRPVIRRSLIIGWHKSDRVASMLSENVRKSPWMRLLASGLLVCWSMQVVCTVASMIQVCMEEVCNYNNYLLLFLHSGSGTSSPPKFLQRISPKLTS